MKNALLRFLIYTVNHPDNSESDLNYEITLNVGGQIISGTIIPRKEFYEAEHNAQLNYYIKEIEKVQLEENGEIQDTPPEDLNIFHLKNAAYWFNNSKIPGGDGTYMIVNIDSVNAYNMGALSIG